MNVYLSKADIRTPTQTFENLEKNKEDINLKILVSILPDSWLSCYIENNIAPICSIYYVILLQLLF